MRGIMSLQISPELAANSLLSTTLFSECDQLMTTSFSEVDTPNYLKKEVCLLLSSQTLKFDEIIKAFFKETYSTLNAITLGFFGEKTTLIKKVIALASDVKLGGYQLMDIVASLKPKEPSRGILTTAIDFDDLGSAATLLEHGADLNERDGGGNTPLHAAAINSKIGAKAVDLLMEQRGFFNKLTRNIASIGVLNKDADTPFFLAAKKDGIPLEVIRSLLDHGAKVNAHKEAKSCIISPTQYSEPRQIYPFMIDPFGVPIKMRVPIYTPEPKCTYGKEHMRTALDFAVGRKNPDINIIRCLLEQGAKDVDHFLEELLSTSAPNMEIVTLVLNIWAGLSAEDRKKSLALRDVVENWDISTRDRTQIIKFLLEKGANPNKEDDDHETPFGLYVAIPLASKAYLEGLKLFINHGAADVNIIRNGRTPLDSILDLMGKGYAMHEAVAYLKSKGALTLKELSTKKSSKDEL